MQGYLAEWQRVIHNHRGWAKSANIILISPQKWLINAGEHPRGIEVGDGLMLPSRRNESLGAFKERAWKP